MAIRAPTAPRPPMNGERPERRRSLPSLRLPRRRPRTGPRLLRVEPHGFLIAAFLTAIWAWWTWKQGAYFGTVLLPGTMLLCGATVLLALGAPTPVRLSLSPPARAALLAIIGLAGWTLASAFWSPAPDVAVMDAQRVFTYALAFGIGIWLCILAGRRMELALAPLAIAAGVVAVATTVTLISGTNVHLYLEAEGTLQYPLGYRNANAAFFLIAMWPALGLATTRALDWRLRGLALGTATLCIELGLLSQSRGSAVAGAVAIVVYLVTAPRRSSAAGWLALAAAPALLVVPHLGPLFHDALAHRPLLGELHSAGRAAAIGAVVAVLVGMAVARFGSRLEVRRDVAARADRLILLGLIVAPLAGIAAFAIAVGNPVDWIGQRVGQFDRGTPTLKQQATRFGFNAGTERGDLWRVALVQAGRDPLFGTGAGGYHYAYLRERHTVVTARDAHSVELETLSELGVPGLALLLVAIVGAGLGIRRARRLGPSAAALGAVALAAGSYWLVHTSIDWFWPYPAVTAPVICLAGAACAPALRTPRSPRRGAGRQLIVTGSVILALSTIPLFLSLSYISSAFDEWRGNPQAAYSDLNSAASWNPLAEEPYLASGAIARAAGDRQRAINAFSDAARKRPEDWVPHYYLAVLYAHSAPRLARAELRVALRLDPRELVLHELKASLGTPSPQ